MLLPSVATITEAEVRTGLDGLLYTHARREQSNPLQGLLLVEKICSSPGFPATSMKYPLALAELLTSTITETYHHHRRVQALVLPAPDTTLEEAYRQIAHDGASANLELCCWSWLYHRYARVDLAITPQRFAAACCVDVRSQRRYAAYGIRRLTERLVLLEREERMRREAG